MENIIRQDERLILTEKVEETENEDEMVTGC